MLSIGHRWRRWREGVRGQRSALLVIGDHVVSCIDVSVVGVAFGIGVNECVVARSIPCVIARGNYCEISSCMP